ncbi:MAG: hypothetical protein IJG80_00175 [Selenomonadaceae bacterium]|nr:hypothetical protein [Selenomonadaceae bacterium]MBQ3727126.1 hypothetical protein [Selenomonadaceae bacterium]
MRDEKGLLVYDDEFRRRFLTAKEIAASDKWTKKHHELITAKDNGDITEQEYNYLCDELDAKHEEELSRIYDEDFGKQSIKYTEEKFFTTPNVATA